MTMNNGRVTPLNEHSGAAVDEGYTGGVERTVTSDVIDALVNLGKVAGVGSSSIEAMQTTKESDVERIRQALEVVLGGTLGHKFHEGLLINGLKIV